MLEPVPFVKNKEYLRRSIHKEFGGNWQGGITPSSTYPYIFIFTGKSGKQHGYMDDWENDKVFRYTGEGQTGDMEYVRGNFALLNHIKNNKRVFLFESTKKAYVKFVSEMVFLESADFETRDTFGRMRRGIKFFLAKAGELVDYLEPEDLFLFKDIPERGDVPNETERAGLVVTRVGHGAYRRSIIHRWENKCAVTGFNNSKILIASHIHPWKDADDFERLDVNNGILLSPTYDALFDKHLITFENTGKIILSDIVSEKEFHKVGVTGKERITKLNSDNIFYLQKHHAIFKG